AFGVSLPLAWLSQMLVLVKHEGVQGAPSWLFVSESKSTSQACCCNPYEVLPDRRLDPSASSTSHTTFGWGDR
ncbi:unnamed protein product, partial [Chrysoparadoxa australica]